ncbi:MmgE/PrpD family protein [Nocardia colli]|uniref:MmgE/PrpD family protein n=1 Tax=Nocardia colli TaxID=2545717 RepID=A0A5N0DV57_9NOCA|nr:MmgE/PrpD family protein [Nocardia colli]KAA8880633.1 MmgE/PrpD family protein [Nocardia colli]
MDIRSIAARLAAWAYDTYRVDLPGPVTARVAAAMLDTTGCLLAGLDSAPAAAVAAYVTETHPGGLFATLPTDRVALVLGTAAHAHDFDDAHLPTLVHPSTVAVPTALAHARIDGLSGAQLVRAVAIGSEISIRIGLAAVQDGSGDSILFDRGLHMTSVCGTVGAAVTAGLLRGLSSGQLAHAITSAMSFSSGLLESNRVGGTVKPVHAGWAAAAGTTAAGLAGHGLSGAPTAFEGRFGFARAFIGAAANLDAVTQQLGDHWHYLSTGVKPFPTNGFTHPGIDTALQLRAAGVAAGQIVEVELALAAPTLRAVADPPADKAEPASGYSARFSAPFTFAVALHGGGGLGVALNDFTDDIIDNPEILALAHRITCTAGDRETKRFPDHLGCTARALLTDGTTRTISVEDSLGSPARPLRPDQIREKFDSNAAHLADPRHLREQLVTVPALPNALDLFTALSTVIATASEQNTPAPVADGDLATRTPRAQHRNTQRPTP